MLDHLLSNHWLLSGMTGLDILHWHLLMSSLRIWDNFNFFSSCFIWCQLLQLDTKTAESSRKKLEHDNVIWPSPEDDTPFWKRDFPTWDSIPEVPDDIQKDSDPMHIAHITAEMAPIAKVGGLGDVVTGLARACLLRGHKVDVSYLSTSVLTSSS